MPLSEADTSRKFIIPKLQAACWDNDPHSIAEQRSITDGRIIPTGKGFVRRPPRRVDYLLRFERNFPLAVVEAKAAWKSAGEGMQQAKEYAEMLGLKFAYATNGLEIIEFDYFTGRESLIQAYPTPADLWARYRTGNGLKDDVAAARLITPMNHTLGKGERYYQEIAVNRAVLGILTGRRRQSPARNPARAAVVVPNGTLFGDGVCARIKEELLKEFNLHTIVRLPNGVFAPYTPIPTNLLFFDRSGPTKEVWYYEHPLPEGRKNYTKTQPLRYEEFEPCLAWWNQRVENDRAWRVPVEELLAANCNLDRKNPRTKNDLVHRSPEVLVASILDKEQRIVEIVGRIKALLEIPL